MPNQSIIHTKRQTSRAKATARAALEAPAEQWVALKCMAADFLDSAAVFESADAQVRELESRATERDHVAAETLEPAACLYDEVRMVANAKLGAAYAGASTFTTPDDLLTACQELRDRLALEQGAAWVGPLLKALGACAQRALEALLGARAAVKALQKAQHAREDAARALRPIFVCFRRLVRCVFGRSSREYRELLDRRSRNALGDTQVELEPEPTDEPAAGDANSPDNVASTPSAEVAQIEQDAEAAPAVLADASSADQQDSPLALPQPTPEIDPPLGAGDEPPTPWPPRWLPTDPASAHDP